jgi:hypothetical protein
VLTIEALVYINELIFFEENMNISQALMETNSMEMVILWKHKNHHRASLLSIGRVVRRMLSFNIS